MCRVGMAVLKLYIRCHCTLNGVSMLHSLVAMALAFELLWGSILATCSIDVIIIAVIAAIVITLYVWQRHHL